MEHEYYINQQWVSSERFYNTVKLLRDSGYHWKVELDTNVSQLFTNFGAA